jgi:SSS family solute:Na+ symporter
MALLIDGLIIIIYFAAITSIGLYMGRRENSLHDFALGGRSMPWWAVMASIIAAETSAATFLGAPGEGFENRSLAYVQLIIGVILGRMVVGYLFLRPYYEYRVYTVYDFLGVRFGPMTKNYVSALFLFMRTLASGTRMFVPSLVMVLAWRMFQNSGNPVKYEPITHVWPYVVAIGLLTVLTCVYTAVGGIKAVIWTDVVQATLMFGSALVAIFTLLHHIGGFHAVAENVPQMTRTDGYFLTGFEPETVEKFKVANHITGNLSAWHYVLLVLGSPYTLFSAVIGSMFLNMAAFGTDQDMVQRLLTAQTYKKSRRSLLTAAVMDLPVASAFTFIGILLWVYYKQHPSGPLANSDVFGNYILNVMPMGIRGLVLAGVFATAMGSLSAALNALATSATNDWYIPYVAKRKSEAHHVAAARLFTAIFAILMIVIASAFAYAKVKDPNVRIIPVVLGIAAFILGPMLGVFLLGMLTKRRGSDVGNLIAITLALATTIVLGELHIYIANLLTGAPADRPTYVRPSWLPNVSFTWFALIGAVVVFVVGAMFTTPQRVLDEAKIKKEQAKAGEARPLALR